MRPIHSALAACLMVCLACGHGPAAAQAGPTEQRVELSSFSFTPSEIHLRPGQSYALILSNVASGGHNFSAPEFFAAARIEHADAALIHGGKVDVPGKSTRTIHLVPAAGTYRLTCTHMMHSTFGMKGTIVVK